MLEPTHDHGPDAHPRLAEILAARKRAELVLAELMSAQSSCEQQLAQTNKKDLVRSVTGRSSLEVAANSTRRMIDVLDRLAGELAQQDSAGLGHTGQRPRESVALADSCTSASMLSPAHSVMLA